MTVTAVIPAYNEAEELPKAVAALRAQTTPPDRIIIALNNAAPGMVEAAEATGAEVRDLGECPGHKGEALNKVMAEVMPSLDDEDVILVQDADSYLDPTFIEAGLAAYGEGVGGVGGVFRGRIDAPRRRNRFLQAYQANEYARYELDIRRQKGRVLVLTGTATLFRVQILREVIAARKDGRLPRGVEQVYDTKVLTEDNELSFALLHLGYRLLSPKGCTLTTETMPTWRTLSAQRNRWKRGALENLFDYGLTRHTLSYWGRQVLAITGLIVTGAYLGTIIWAVAAGNFKLQVFWLGVTALFALERAFTVRRRGIRSVLVAGMVVIEMVYDLFLQAVQFRAFAEAAVGRERRW